MCVGVCRWHIGANRLAEPPSSGVSRLQPAITDTQAEWALTLRPQEAYETLLCLPDALKRLKNEMQPSSCCELQPLNKGNSRKRPFLFCGAEGGFRCSDGQTTLSKLQLKCTVQLENLTAVLGGGQVKNGQITCSQKIQIQTWIGGAIIIIYFFISRNINMASGWIHTLHTHANTADISTAGTSQCFFSVLLETGV